MTYGFTFPVGYACYTIDQNDSNTIELFFRLDHKEQPWFYLIKPDFESAISRVEMRKAYVDRVWRAAFKEWHNGSKNIKFN